MFSFPKWMTMRFKPIKPKKVSSQIADQIRESILAGDFSPGDKLPPERELAEMFGVSRPSVREALTDAGYDHLDELFEMQRMWRDAHEGR